VRPSLARLLRLALVLGLTGFGGGFAVTQRLKQAVVDGERWMGERAFLDCVGLANTLPGAASTNLLSLVGLKLGRTRDALLAVVVFLAPSVAMMVVFAAIYDRLRDLDVLGALLDGMSSATVGVVAAVAVDLGRVAVKRPLEWALASASAVALATRTLNLLEIVAVAGVVGAIAMRPPRTPAAPKDDPNAPYPTSQMRSLMVPLGAWAAALAPAVTVFLVFARIGVATFGGGFAMIAPLDHEVVHARGWLLEPAFDDAVVFAQVTPGPVAIASTFIGWRHAGPAGALAATLGTFAPPFVIAVAAGRSMRTFRTNPMVRGFLAGVAPAVVGVIAASSYAMWRAAVHSILDGGIALATFLLLLVARRTWPIVPLAAAGAVTLIARYV
jgi:chromate transporter